MPSPEQHALLSASSAHRWLNCPGSARLAEQFPNQTSPYAEAGRVAHAIAELKARKYFLEPMSARTYNAQLKKLRDSPHFDKSMDENTDTYLEVLKETALFFEKAPFVALETRVDFSDSVPEGFGTADCIMIGSGTIVIVDYKNGAGVPVEAEDNPQMKLYALGALQVYAPIYGDTIQRAVLKIVQPNAGGTKTWETTVQALKLWAFNTVKPIARIAYDGKGGFSAGGWCGFCPAKAQCSARARQMPGRFTFTGGSTTGGAVLYDNGKFLYSHHATDPCGGKLVNAFDLVRIHKFGDKDDEAAPGTPTNQPASLLYRHVRDGSRGQSGRRAAAG